MMEARIKVQDDLYVRIKRAKENFKKSPKERLCSPDYLCTRLEVLEELWSQFSLTHTQIVQDSDVTQLGACSYVTKGIYDKTEELFIEYKFELRSMLSKLNIKEVETTKVQVTETSKSSIRLPKIVIPVFSGRYSEWTTFRDLFTSLIHNNKSLDDVQRLHYLKSHLSGEAEQLLRHVSVTQENYGRCWEQLERRYNNKRYLANHILKRLFSQRNSATESAHAIKELLDTTNECLNALKNINIDISSWDIIIVYIICLKLDAETRKQWELKSSEFNEELPTLKQFNEFLETRFRALEFVDSRISKASTTFGNKGSNFPANPKVHYVATLSCAYCAENHKIGNCKGFAKLDTNARRNFAQSSRLCFNCLGVNHNVFACRQSTRCRICKKKHHSLLHPKSISNATDSKVENSSVDKSLALHASSSGSSQNDEPTVEVKSYFSTTRGQVLLATALVNVTSKNGYGTTLRCLLDQGSQASLITEAAVQLLGLKKISHMSTISGLGSDESAPLASQSMVNFKFQSRLDPKREFCVNAFVLSKLTSFLPEKKVVVNLWSELSSKELADPYFEMPDKIDLLLGADIYGQILLEGVVKGRPGAPIAQKTALGWILSGPIQAKESVGNRSISVNHVQVNENELLKRFWELEAETSAIPSKKGYTDEEQKCEDIFSATTKRDSKGRYIVKLPFRGANPSCKYGNSKSIAARRFSQLEKRFARDPELKKRYAQVIQEYIDLGHMEKVAEADEHKSDVVYLPHHAVVREDKTTSKVRVVYDASCPGENGVSLNQDLLVGPTLQADLRHIILRWRKYPVCLVADIVKMYRQVKIDIEDTDYQRILWRNSPDDELDHYRLLTVTFGTASAPYLAVRALHQAAYDEGKQLPLAAERVLGHFYMDDLLTGCETVEEGKEIYKQLLELLGKAGFELQKWTSNDELLTKHINGDKEPLKDNLELNADTTMKILGLTWNRSTDEFEYFVQLPPCKIPVTKRSVISDIARLFDPLGWLQPVIISAKIFIQKLWLSGIEWDDEVPPQLLKEWLSYREHLSQLTKFKLPRWIHFNNNIDCIELQGFADASNAAFAAVVYTRIVDSAGNVHVSLVAAKTKVAPIKQVSIPRLELCGAVLLTRLLMEVSRVLGVSMTNIHAWTDSSVVLSWLNSHPNRWKTFVANRVSEIITSLEPHHWAHVASKDNPADLASRGTYQSVDERLWKEGPSWLKEKYLKYKKLVNKETTLEEKSKKLCLVNICQSDGALEIMARFSSLRKLIRVVAFCKRFIKRIKPNKAWLTTKELQESWTTCIKLVQGDSFKGELVNLKKENKISKSSKLTSLNPTLGDDGVMRVGGRLQHSELSEQMKHPVILPQRSHFTDLIIADAHERTLHGTPLLMLNYLKTKYFILGVKNLVKYHVRKCVVCIRYSSSPKSPLMGQLPSVRGTGSRPFRHSGVDYAGPINIRTSKGRGYHAYKGYICLFICMATRAIHLEAVSDLTSRGFLAAFKRFVARRGQCSDLYSDNGTNFVGAARELKQLYAEEKSTIIAEIAEQLATNGTNWHFIPPHAPNFGGLWEAGIKSTKHHLKRVVGNSTLTFEEMSTVLSQIEACLNSRPISNASDNINDPMPLTPGHFLVGEPLILVPDSNYELSKISSLKRWQFTQRLVQEFWRRWSSEYLTQFYHRYKWAHRSPEPSEGDIVLIKEDGLPPARWLYGIIIQKHPGLDGITRVVSLKCKDNIIKRPVKKLCFLPVEA